MFIGLFSLVSVMLGKWTLRALESLTPKETHLLHFRPMPLALFGSHT